MRSRCAALFALSAAALVTGSPAARAQDRDPFDAVREQEALRAKQAGQIHRAEDRVTDPFRADSGGTGTTREKSPAASPPSSAPTGPGHGSIAPWVLGGVALAVVAAFWALRDRGRGNASAGGSGAPAIPQ